MDIQQIDLIIVCKTDVSAIRGFDDEVFQGLAVFWGNEAVCDFWHLGIPFLTILPDAMHRTSGTCNLLFQILIEESDGAVHSGGEVFGGIVIVAIVSVQVNDVACVADLPGKRYLWQITIDLGAGNLYSISNKCCIVFIFYGIPFLACPNSRIYLSHYVDYKI
jgi:hypothetical protein